MSQTNHNPYAAPAAALALGEPTTTPLPERKAEVLKRLFAALIDFGAYLGAALCAAFCVWILLLICRQLGIGENQAASNVSIAIGCIPMIAFLVVQLTLLARHSQTFGKRVQRIRIVRSDGSRIGFGRLLGLRIVVPALIGMVPFLGTLFSLANMLWIFGEERRCLHDYFADTIVVNT